MERGRDESWRNVDSRTLLFVVFVGSSNQASKQEQSHHSPRIREQMNLSGLFNQSDRTIL